MVLATKRSNIIFGKRRNGSRTNDLDGNGTLTVADVVLLVDILSHPDEATKVWVPETITTGGEKGPFD